MKKYILQFNQSISWIFESQKIAKNNPKTTLYEAISKHIINDKCSLINHGLLFSACYMYFLLPKEKDVDKIKIDSSLFLEISNKNDIPRRLRNSIAHGKIKVLDNGNIVFSDNNQNRSNPFEAKISPINLAKLIEETGKNYAFS